MVASYVDMSTYKGLGSRARVVDPSLESEPVHLDTLREMGWNVECRGCYWLARHEHRRIELFRDGRVIFKDPTITAVYQLDDEWLKVIRFVWPNVQF